MAQNIHPKKKWYDGLPKWTSWMMVILFAVGGLIVLVDIALMVAFALQASGVSWAGEIVATATPSPTTIVTSTAVVATPTATAASTSTAIPTSTAVPATATPSPTLTVTATPIVSEPTSTPTPTATAVVWPTATPTPAITDWRGEYFAGDLIGSPDLVRNDKGPGGTLGLDFDWGYNAPANGLPADGFSARWTRTIQFSTGLYRFHALVDDGLRLYVDGALVIDTWRDGARRELVADHKLEGGWHTLRVEYYEGSGVAAVQVWWEKLASYPDWKGEYWSNRDLSGSPVLVRNDVGPNGTSGLDFDWGGGSPAPAIPGDGFSARWTRTIHFEMGIYRFRVRMDDGARLWVDGRLILDAWSDHSNFESVVDHALTQGPHTITLEYYERTGNARIGLRWDRDSDPSFSDWKGEYWPNRDLSGSPSLVRNDAGPSGTPGLDFQWKDGSPAPGLPSDDFSARWTRSAYFDGKTYRFHALVDDGVRLWVDGVRVIDAWYDQGTHEVTGDLAVVKGWHQIRVEYYEHSGDARITAWWQELKPTYPDWKGEYWPNRDLSGSPSLVRNDVGPNGTPGLDFDWGLYAPAAGLPRDSYSARWTRQVTFSAGTYRFFAWADDGIRVYIDGKPIIDEWHGWQDEVYTADRALGGTIKVTVEYSEHTGDARVRFWWKRVGDLPTATATPSPTPTATATMTPTPTATATTEPTATSSPTPTATTEPTATATSSPTPTATTEPTATATATATSSPTPTATTEPTATATSSPTPTPTIEPIVPEVRLNEVLPAPDAMDWDGDGTASETDEWIELYNGGTTPVDISGWQVDNGSSEGSVYLLSPDTILGAGEYLVLYRQKTGIALADGGSQVRLLDLSSKIVDIVTIGALEGDESYGRNGEGLWQAMPLPSPGKANVTSTAG